MQAHFSFASLAAALSSPIAASTDPVTSHDSAREVTASGKREGQLLAVLALVRKYPGCTSLELSRKSDLGRYEIARRLPELRRGGLVEQGEARQCRISTHKAITWRPVEKA